MSFQPDENNNKLNDDEMIFAAKQEICQTVISAVRSCISKNKFKI